MRITAQEAEAFFSHPSQRKAAMLDGPLPEHFQYHAIGPVCGVFHGAAWPGVVMGHIGVNPSGWGALDASALAVLQEAWDEYQPDRIIGWVKESNRAMRALCLRLGFEIDGRLPLPEPVICYGWRP